MNFKPKHFSREKNKEFYTILKARINQYFKSKKISKKGNSTLITKSIFMGMLFLIPYILIMKWDGFNLLLYFLLWVIMGIAVAGIGFSIMHDANHSTFSKSKWMNNLFSLSAQLIGANSTTWKIQHNILHHTYTNVDNYDLDIETTSLLRFSPHQKRKKFHSIQHFYAWFLYSFMTLGRVFFTDFKQMIQFKNMGLLKNLSKEWLQLIFWKLVYLGYILFVPVIFSEVNWYFVISGFILMHLTTGFILSIVFQTAHIVPESEFIKTESTNISENWAVHQIKTTANFAPNSKLFSWYIGGLNYQIEHHLFPHISHVHYANISIIVRDTANEFNIQYISYKNFITALIEHYKMLKILGRI